MVCLQRMTSGTLAGLSQGLVTEIVVTRDADGPEHII